MYRFERSPKDPNRNEHREAGRGGRTRVRLLTLIAIASIASTGGSAHATDATSTVTEPPHVRWAERLVAELTPDRNAYAWNPTYVVWTEDGTGPARNRSVCSSFVSHDLERAYGFDRSELIERFGVVNPQAKDYYATIAAERGFERIPRLDAARPGDILAVRYPAGSHPTGHVMILDGIPRPRTATEPVVEKTTQYEVAVIDSSHSYHGFDDTRYRGKERAGGGVGRGTLRLYAAADGTIAGYAWSTRRVSKYYDANERQIVIGRFQRTYAGPTATPAAAGDEDDRDDSAVAHE